MIKLKERTSSKLLFKTFKTTFCYLSREHFITVRTWYALDSAVFGLSHVDVSDVGAQVGLGGEYPHTHVTPLVAGVVCQAGHLAGELLLLKQSRLLCLPLIVSS